MRIALNLIGMEMDSQNNPSDDLTNGHELEKVSSARRCRVCYHDAIDKTRVKKSSYRCKKCSVGYRKDIILCVENCFGKFHRNRNTYT